MFPQHLLPTLAEFPELHCGWDAHSHFKAGYELEQVEKESRRLLDCPFRWVPWSPLLLCPATIRNNGKNFEMGQTFLEILSTIEVLSEDPSGVI